MLAPMGPHLVNSDDVKYAILRGPDKILVEFRDGTSLNVDGGENARQMLREYLQAVLDARNS